MSAQVDELKPFRVAEAYCYDAGATNAARNLRDAVAALIAERPASEDEEQRARGFLAAEYERDGKAGSADHIRTQPLLPNKARAVRAIAAALRQQPAPVDLGQFRGAVMFLKERASQLPLEDVSRDKFIAEADRLLVLIDNAGKLCPCGEATCTESWEPGCGLGESVEHAVPAEREPPRGDELRAILARQPAPVVFRNDGNSEADFIAHHADACTACGGSGHKSDQQPAPVVDDADATEILALSLDEFGYHTEARNVRAGEDLDEYRTEMWAIRAALARAQGVQPIIDNAGKAASVEQVAWQRRYAHQLPAGGMCAWHEITRDEYEAAVSAEYPDRTYEYRALYTTPHQPAPVVDDAMVSRATAAYNGIWGSTTHREAMRAALTAALARAREVQS